MRKNKKQKIKNRKRPKIFSVNILHHPFEAQNVTIEQILYRRQSLAQIKRQFVIGGKVAIFLDGKQIPTKQWSKKRVKPGCKVDIIPMAAGPAVSLVFAAVKALITWKLITNIAIAFAISYLGGKLFNQNVKQPRLDVGGREESQSFGWNPHTTQREGLPRVRAYGKNLHFGNVIARWTDVDESGSEILYMLIDHGDGPTVGIDAENLYNDVYLNDQPAANFSGIDLQQRRGTLNQTCMTDFEQTKLEYRPAQSFTYDGGSITFTTPNNFFDDLEYTLEFSRGIRHYQSDGSATTHSIGVKIEISEHGENDWTTLLNTSIEGNQLAAIYKAYKVSEQSFECSRGTQYDLRFTKTTEDQEADTYCDDVKLRAVREVVDVAFKHPGKALLGIKALATDQLSGHIDVKCIREDRLVPVYNGVAWSIEYTRNRAWVDLDIACQPVISGDGDGTPYAIERNDGMDLSRVDTALIYEWAEWCDDQVPDGAGGTEARMTCDLICDYETNVWSIFYEIAQIGRMYPYWQGYQLTGWIDKVVSQTTGLVTFDNIIAKSWRNAWAKQPDMAGNIEIFYRDESQGYERKHFPVPNENAGLYTRPVSVEGIGVTSRSLAIRVGKHSLLRNQLILNINNFRMYKDAVLYSLGDVIPLQHNVPNWGKSYRIVKKLANNKVKLDRTVEASAEDLLYLRGYNSSTEQIETDVYTVASVSGDEVTIEEIWDINPIKNWIVAIGEDGAIKERRIIKIVQTVDNYFDITVETYDEDLFDSDDTQPTNPNPDYVWPAPANPLSKPVTRWEVIDLINQMMSPQPDIEIPWLSNCEWSGNSVDTVSWAAREVSEPILFRFRGVTYEITADSTTDEFIYWDPNYTDQFRTTNNIAVAIGAGCWLMCVNQDGVPLPANAMQIIHGGVIQAGTITAGTIISIGWSQVSDDDENKPENNADVTGERLADSHASLLANWRLDIVDAAGRPAGIYPNERIEDFSQVDWLDSNKDAIKILSTPNTKAGYGFPAIPIDDKQKYKIVIRHKVSAASVNSFYLRLNEYNDSLPVGKTHIGYSNGGEKAQTRSSYQNLNNGTISETDWTIDEYTYTPTSGTKYASFSFLVWDPTAGAEYHVDYVLMYLVPKTADEMDESATRFWAGDWRHDSDVTKINGGKIYTKSITAEAGAIDDLAVDTLQIADDAVTVPESAYTAAGGATGDIQTLSVIATGQPILILGQCIVTVTAASPWYMPYRLKILRDSTVIYDTGTCKLFILEGSAAIPVHIAVEDTPDADSYTYKLNLSEGGTAAERLLYKIETKK